MLFSARTQMMSDLSFPAALKKIAAWGYDGAEISVLNREFKVRKEFFADNTLRKIRSALTNLNKKACAVSCHVDYVNEQEKIDLIKKTINQAQKLELKTVIINGAVSQAETDEQKKKEWQKMVNHTAELCKTAHKNGIRLAKEFEPGFITDNSAKLLEVISEVAPLPLYANLDLGHVFLGDPDPRQAVESLAGKIVHGHVENMKSNVHDHLLPSEGDMNLSLYLKMLTEQGFSGPLALDLYKYDYTKVAAGALEYLRQLAH